VLLGKVLEEENRQQDDLRFELPLLERPETEGVSRSITTIRSIL
jgi:hypothetical protein